MSIFDNAKNLIDQNDEMVDKGLEQAGELAKGRFAGFESQIDSAVDHAQGATGAGDTVPDEQAPPAPEEQAPPA